VVVVAVVVMCGALTYLVAQGCVYLQAHWVQPTSCGLSCAVFFL
jgi:hypothetical protein